MTPHHPTDDPRWDRLIHLIAGELSTEEASALQDWIAADPDRQQALARLEQVWHATRPSANSSPDAWDAEAVLRRIRLETGGTGRVIARVGSPFEIERISRRRSRVGVVLRAAAVGALAIGGGLLWRLHVPASPAVSAPALATAEYRTASGERLSLGLPDGTRVILAPGSVLRRSSTYGGRERIVYLEGEAYFYVTHDSTRPFAVHTARAVAHDLGTRFVVRAYSNEATTDVVVSEGLVAVTRANPGPGGTLPTTDSVLLQPRQRASITADGSLVFTRSVALDPYFGWISGRLVFERTPLHQVVHQLERWYGIEVRIADAALRGVRLTATLREEGATEAIDLVATSLGLSVSQVGRTYVLDRTER